MSYSVKRGKVAKRPRLRVGDQIDIDYGLDASGRYWWKFAWYDLEHIYGPFYTLAEAEKHSEATVLGPDCEISDRGERGTSCNE
jgi:hypothetical protein